MIQRLWEKAEGNYNVQCKEKKAEVRYIKRCYKKYSQELLSTDTKNISEIMHSLSQEAFFFKEKAEQPPL